MKKSPKRMTYYIWETTIFFLKFLSLIEQKLGEKENKSKMKLWLRVIFITHNPLKKMEENS